MTKAALKNFSSYPRVIYAKNPLVQVVAAIRFPLLLSLLQDYPTEFQQKVAGRFPLAGISSVPVVPIPVAEGFAMGTYPSRQFNFQTADQTWTLSLEPTGIGLSCSRYNRWEEFREVFSASLVSFFEVFKPSQVNRLGLRYIDLINRRTLGIENQTLSEILRPELLKSFTFFTDDADKLSPFQFSTELEIEPGRVRIVVSTVISPDNQEGVLIDTDCYVEPTTFRTASEIIDHADRFHAYSGVIFRNCITDQLHKSLEPALVTG